MQNYLLWSGFQLSKSRGTWNKKPTGGNFQPNSLFQSEFPCFSTYLSLPLQGLRIGDGTLSQFGMKTVYVWHYTASKSPFKSLIDNVIAAFSVFYILYVLLEAKCGSFATSESPDEKFGGLFRLFKAGRLIWLENFGRGVFVHIIHHHPASFRDCLHRGFRCMPHTYIHVPIRISIGPFTPWSRRNAPARSLPAHKYKTWEWEPTVPVCPQL